VTLPAALVVRPLSRADADAGAGGSRRAGRRQHAHRLRTGGSRAASFHGNIRRQAARLPQHLTISKRKGVNTMNTKRIVSSLIASLLLCALCALSVRSTRAQEPAKTQEQEEQSSAKAEPLRTDLAPAAQALGGARAGWATAVTPQALANARI